MIHKFNPKKTKYIGKVNSILKLFYHHGSEYPPIDCRSLKRILIIDFGLLGDMVMSIPFFRTIKKNIPDACVTLVCSVWAEKILKNQGVIDDFILLNTVNHKLLRSWKTVLKDLLSIRKCLKGINKQEYDLAIEPRGDLRHIYFMYYCKAKRKASYNYTGGECLLTDVVKPPQNIEHVIDEKLYLLQALGFQVYDNERIPKLSLTKAQGEENVKFLQEHNLEQKLIVGVHPGASTKSKQWGGFAELTKRIAAVQSDVAFLVFEGPGEKQIADTVLNSVFESSCHVIKIKEDIEHYIQKVALCNVMFCNDSGAGHIAAALGVEAFVIFGPTLPSLTMPYGENKIHVFSKDNLECKPCPGYQCFRDNECMNGINVDDVYNEFLKTRDIKL